MEWIKDVRHGVGYVDIVSLEEYTEKDNTAKRETIHVYDNNTRPTGTNYEEYKKALRKYIARTFRTTFIWPSKTEKKRTTLKGDKWREYKG